VGWRRGPQEPPAGGPAPDPSKRGRKRREPPPPADGCAWCSSAKPVVGARCVLLIDFVSPYMFCMSCHKVLSPLWFSYEISLFNFHLGWSEFFLIKLGGS